MEPEIINPTALKTPRQSLDGDPTGPGLPSQGSVSVGDLRRWAVGVLGVADTGDPLRAADWLLEEVLQCSRSRLIGYPEEEVPGAKAEQFREMVRRRLGGEPLQYIVGWTEFYGIRLAVSPDVLIPRPETEILVDVGLELIQDLEEPAVLDVGTGSGCIAIALGALRPDARVTAVDISERALEVARRNAEALDLEIEFELGDVRAGDGVFTEEGSFDLMISNPPYVHPSELPELPREVSEFEPRAALFTGDNPLEFYRLLLSQCATMLRPAGSLAVEVHTDRAGDVASLFEEAGLSGVETRADLAGRRRVVWGRWRRR